MAKKNARYSHRLVKELLSKIDKDELLKDKNSRAPYLMADCLGRYVREACKCSTLHSYGNQLYGFDGEKYSAIDYTTFSNIIYEVLMELGLPDGNLKRVWYITKICHQAAMCNRLEPDAGVVTFTNCVFDMDGRVACRFTPKWVSVTKMPYDYDANAHCTRWRMFLDEVLPDKQMQSILQEFLGCCFIDRRKAKMERMLVLLGPGANGKSVVHDVVRKLLGEDNVTSFGMNELTQGYEAKKNYVTINGKRLNYASEISAQTFVNVGDQLKKLISGEPIMARENYQSNLTVTDVPLMMANANKLPAMRGDDMKAMTRRFVIIPFKVEIPVERQNPMLARELCEELPGIFNWVMEGRERYIANGFAFSDVKKIEKSVEGYRMEGSTTAEFLIARGYDARRRENMEQPKWVKAGDLYREYNEWCLAKGKPQDSIDTQIKFGLRLNSEFGFRKKKTSGGICYGIYADKVKMEWKPEAEKNLDRVNIDNKPFFDIQGKKWVRTRSGLVDVLKVSHRLVQECVNQGVFAGYVRQEGQAKLYEVEGCRRALAAYVRAKEEEKKLNRPTAEEKRIWVMRGKFNKKMEKYGEPYRKYGAKTMKQEPDGVFTLVPDDWEYEKEIPVDKQSNVIKRRKNQITTINLEEIEDE